MRIDRLICPASPGEQIAVNPAAATFCGKEQATQRAEFEGAVEVDVFLALGVAVGEVGVHVDQTGHHEQPGVVEHPVAARAPRRSLFGPDIVENAFLVEDDGLADPGIVLARGKKLAAAHKGLHRDLLQTIGTTRKWTALRRSGIAIIFVAQASA